MRKSCLSYVPLAQNPNICTRKMSLPSFQMIELKKKNASLTASEEKGWHCEHGSAAMISAPRRPPSNNHPSAHRISDALEHLEVKLIWLFIEKQNIWFYTFCRHKWHVHVFRLIFFIWSTLIIKKFNLAVYLFVYLALTYAAIMLVVMDTE